MITPRWERQCHSYDAHVAGVNVGYINVLREGDDYRIDGMYVTGEYRGRGIARQLMQAVVDCYREHKITLKVGPFYEEHEDGTEEILTKPQLLRFYRTFGFSSRTEDPTYMTRKADAHGRTRTDHRRR